MHFISLKTSRLKKIGLLLSLLTSAHLANAANAANSTNNAGAVNTPIKNSSLNQSNDHGFYLGLGAGAVFSDNQTITNVYSADTQQNNASANTLGFRTTLGYNFARRWALELGYTNYGTLQEKQGPGHFDGVPISTDTKVKQYDVDLMGVYRFPLSTHWDVYLKAGLAYLKGELDYNVSSTGPISVYLPWSYSGHWHGAGINPAYGGGAGRNFDDGHFFLGLDWTKVSAWSGKYNDSLNSKLQSSSLLSLNLIYRFDQFSTASSNDSYLFDNNPSSGIYLGVMAGGSVMYDNTSAGAYDFKTAPGAVFNIGYMFNRYIGLEADLVAYNIQEQKYTTQNALGQTVEQKNPPLAELSAMIKFNVPMSEDFNFFLKVGPDVGYVDRVGLMYAGGIGYNVTPATEISAQYFTSNSVLDIPGGETKVGLVGLGIQHLF